MRATIAIFATLLVAAGAFAQQDQASETGPFTEQQAERMSSVWPDIREAETFDDIDWEAVGLSRAPGNNETHELMRDHWESLRTAAEFSDIDWEAIPEYRDR